MCDLHALMVEGQSHGECWYDSLQLGVDGAPHLLKFVHVFQRGTMKWLQMVLGWQVSLHVY